MNDQGNPKVFISYAWTNTEKVMELAKRLRSDGVDVIIDKWDLKGGHDTLAFMEQCVTDSSIDKVLIICDKEYTEKADRREGGVGNETVIISAEIYNKVNQEKFIPVIFEIDDNGEPYRPAYIKSRLYINLSSEDNYEPEYEHLLRNLHNRPLHRKPALGKIPEWLENEQVDYSPIRNYIKQIVGNKSDNPNKMEFMVRKTGEEFVKAIKNIAPKAGDNFDDALIAQISEEKTVRDLFIDYIEALIKTDLPIETIIPNFIEDFFNETNYLSRSRNHPNNELEFFEFVIWEIFICMTAILIYYKRFSQLRQILIHTYFLRKNDLDSTVMPRFFNNLNSYFYTIEEICNRKGDPPYYLSFSAEILLRREKRPIISKDSLVNADVSLYQLSRALNLVDQSRRPWFPRTYVYMKNAPQQIWVKMQSKEYCQNIMFLFGVSTIEQLKEMVKNQIEYKEVSYPDSFEAAPTILSSITPEDIGKYT
jgi:GGDEF domain-containing protein